jgi:hypothetical protein
MKQRHRPLTALVNTMRDRLKARCLLTVCLLGGIYSLTACSYLTDFVLVNATEQPIEIRYIIKKPAAPFPPFPPSQTLPITPAVKDVSQLHQQIAWRELSASQYIFDPDSRKVMVTLRPNEALRIEQRNLVDGKADDAHQAARFSIEEVDITGSYGGIKLQGEQLRKMFVPESKKVYTLTYR